MRTGLAVLLATLVTAVLALPAGAAAYEVDVNRTTLRPGQVLTARVTAPGACDWVLTWNGALRHGSGRTFTASWTAPEVAQRTRLPLRVRCFRPSGPRAAAPKRTAVVGGGTSQRITVTVPAATDRTLSITVLPRLTVVSPPDAGGTGGTPGLPDTGGPLLWLLFAGLGAAFVGSVLVLVGGRREQA